MGAVNRVIDVDHERRAARHTEVEARDAERDKMNKWTEQQLNLSRIVATPDTSPATVARQMGQYMFRQELETRIKKLNSALTIDPNPSNKNPKFASVHWNLGVAKRLRVCGCERDVFPEYSIMDIRSREVPLIVNHMDRDTPAFYNLDVPGEEVCRGWRTVLIALIRAGALTIPQVEREFGPSERASWAHHLGKRNFELPF